MPDGRAVGHVIAGEALGAKAVIETRTPIGYLHWILSGRVGRCAGSGGPGRLVYVFKGAVRVAGREVTDGQLAILGHGNRVQLEASGRKRSC